ncbi:MAG: hypothetical protein IJF94_03725 [Eubacterium sp.]|nr:hypothetical protein [Eubacterium sp.]
MKEFDLEAVLLKLKSERKIFVSEADFQLALAWKIKEMYSDKTEVRCEYPVELNGIFIHLDILVIWGKKKEWIPIEVKYKTTTLDYIDDDVEYCLKHQGAKDCGCYDYIKDIKRIQDIKNDPATKRRFLKGYTVFLTNDHSYKKSSRRKFDKKGKLIKPYYAMFSIAEKEKDKNGNLLDNKIVKPLNWLGNTGKGTKRGRTDAIEIDGEYPCNWQCYNKLEVGGNDEFIFLLHEIK